jgi:hypothetical protein
MLRLTAFLVVVTLTGLPVVPAVCLSWCEAQEKTTIGNCHDEAGRNGSPILISGSTMCSALLERPFTREETRPVLGAVSSLPVSRIAGSPLSPTAHTPAGEPRSAGPARQPLVLRL